MILNDAAVSTIALVLLLLFVLRIAFLFWYRRRHVLRHHFRNFQSHRRRVFRHWK